MSTYEFVIYSLAIVGAAYLLTRSLLIAASIWAKLKHPAPLIKRRRRWERW